MAAYGTIDVATAGQVATITILPVEGRRPGAGANHHWELASAFSDLRGDNAVRVIVVTGVGDVFSTSPPTRPGQPRRGELHEPKAAWPAFTGIVRCHQAMAEIEKPVVARVNGDCVGFGQSIAFACDLIVAVDDARFVDHHMGMDEVEGFEREFGIVPGDGGLALLPLYMSPALAKEYLMLSREYRAAELARLGIINYAVPRAELDARVNDIVARLLKRSAYALAWTKRVANRRVAEHLNLTLDAAAAYEMLTLVHREDHRSLD
jgi:enoyl-CoA hydratase/carnithine racemase